MTEMTRRNPGAPLEPTGNKLLSNMGPAAYASRSNLPDLTLEGAARIVPMRTAPGYHLDGKGPDPRNMTVIGGDGEVAGTVIDVWIDRAEPCARYYEVSVVSDGHSVLVPFNCTRIKASANQVRVKSIFAAQFANVPRTARPDRVTLLEEDMIMGYFAGGYLYASPERSEPLF